MKKILVLLVFILSFVNGAILSAKDDYILTSPDGSLKANITTGKGITWSIEKNGTLVMAPSSISMAFTDGTVYGGDSQVLKSAVKKVDKEIKTTVYKKAVVKDTYRELTLSFKAFDLIFRAYDEAIAYRFVSRSNIMKRVEYEQADFVFPEDFSVYTSYVRDYNVLSKEFDNSFENVYSHFKLSEWDQTKISFLPLLVEAGEYKVCITESDLLDYPGMYLYSGSADGDGSVNLTPKNSQTGLRAIFAPYPKSIEQGGHNNLQGLVTSTEGYIAVAKPGVSFPWRIVNVATEDKDLLDNDMVFKLASAQSSESDFSWVKPGKVAWDWWNGWTLYGVDFKAGINTETYKYYIDFASKKGIEYVILDEGWAVNLQADLFQIVPEINLPEIIRYAKARNVGIILWAGYWAFEKDMEKVCKTYSEMGVKGFKVDFMNRDDQAMVDFYTRAAKMAAKYHLLLDFHGAFKPAGLQRTYPNVLNYEGVNGLEQVKWSSIRDFDQVLYDVTIPYIRMVAGSMDYTQGAMKNASRMSHVSKYYEPESQGTRCHQLAEYVIFEAPLTMLCDSPSNYMNEPECTDFIASVPTIWDETLALDGKVAEYAVIARKSGDAWYVGALNNWTPRDLEINLGFIPSGNYELVIFKDGLNADKAARDYKKETIAIPFDRKLKIHMASGGGWVAKIVKK